MSSQSLYVLDAILFCSSSKQESIRSIAFSALNSLSEYSSKDKFILAQIKRDLKKESSNKNFIKGLMKRLNQEKENFLKECRAESVESTYPGIFSLT